MSKETVESKTEKEAPGPAAILESVCDKLDALYAEVNALGDTVSRIEYDLSVTKDYVTSNKRALSFLIKRMEGE